MSSSPDPWRTWRSSKELACFRCRCHSILEIPASTIIRVPDQGIRLENWSRCKTTGESQLSLALLENFTVTLWEINTLIPAKIFLELMLVKKRSLVPLRHQEPVKKCVILSSSICKSTTINKLAHPKNHSKTYPPQKVPDLFKRNRFIWMTPTSDAKIWGSLTIREELP